MTTAFTNTAGVATASMFTANATEVPTSSTQRQAEWPRRPASA
jgi:hypothetical protein